MSASNNTPESERHPRHPRQPQQPQQPQYPQYPVSTQHSPLPIHRFLRQWMRYSWLSALLVALAMALTALSVLRQPRSYASSARLLNHNKVKLLDAAPNSEELSVATQIELLLSNRVAERARKRVRTLHPEYPEDWTVSVTARQAPGTSILRLECQGAEPRYTQTYLTAVIDEYLDARKELRSTSSQDTLASLTHEIADREKQLKTAQEKLISEEREIDMNILQEQNQTASAQLSKLRVQEADMVAERQLLDVLAFGEKAGSTRSGSGPGDSMTARQRLDLMKIEREELNQVLLPKHPKLQRLNQEIARMEELVELYRKQTAEQMDAARASFSQRLGALQQQITNWQAQAVSASRQLAGLEGTRMEVARIQAMHERLLNLLQNLDVNQNLEQESVMVIEPASAAWATPFQLSRKLVQASMAGLLLSLAFIGLVTRSDDRFYNQAEVARSFEQELLVGIPLGARTSTGTVPLLQVQDDRHAFAEAFKTLRSSLIFHSLFGARPKVFLITSSVPREGKSTIAMNLARALAFTQAKVLLIDADLRLGVLAQRLGVPQSPGLTELLSPQAFPGEAPRPLLPLSRADRDGIDLTDDLSKELTLKRDALDDWVDKRLSRLVVATDLPNLSFLPPGAAVHGAGELLLDTAMDALLQRARARYDFVIIDSPPLLAADDSTSLAPRVDACLFVVRRARTRERIAKTSLNNLRQRQASVAGIIFNLDRGSRDGNYYSAYSQYYAKTKPASNNGSASKQPVPAAS